MADSTSKQHRVLVVANETCGSATLCDEVGRRAAGGAAEVFMISPALTRTRLEYWLSDVDRAIGEAQARLDRSISSLSELGIDARRAVGDPDPLTAIGDALAVFPADEIFVYTHPSERANWLERDLAAKAHERFGIPVHEVVLESSAANEAGI